MDIDAIRLLQDLPIDLNAQGWQWERSQSGAPKTLTRTTYNAVYARPFDRGIDPEESAYHYKRHWYVWVSTTGHESASWDEARQQAIELMREADAKRQEAE